MRKIMLMLAVALSIGATLPAFANSAVGSNPSGEGAYQAEAGAGGR
jgi:hypothetical protein